MAVTFRLTGLVASSVQSSSIAQGAAKIRAGRFRLSREILGMHALGEDPRLRDWDMTIYPDSDGEPMAETDIHRDQMVDLITALQEHYQNEDVYVSGNILLYYEKGEPRSHISPDVLIVFGIKNEPREIYRTWLEGKPPDLVVEITSKTTKFKDVGIKKGLYEALGVREYLLFDLTGDYLTPNFQAYRLVDGIYVRALLPENTGFLSQFGLQFRVVDGELRVYDSQSRLLMTPTEKARQQMERADSEASRADAEASRADAEASRADAEASRADTEAIRAEEQARRAEALAQRLRDLGVDPNSI